MEKRRRVFVQLGDHSSIPLTSLVNLELVTRTKPWNPHSPLSRSGRGGERALIVRSVRPFNGIADHGARGAMAARRGKGGSWKWPCVLFWS